MRTVYQELLLCFRNQYPNPTSEESMCAMLIALDAKWDEDAI